MKIVCHSEGVLPRRTTEESLQADKRRFFAGACPERHEILPLLRRLRMTGSEGAQNDTTL